MSGRVGHDGHSDEDVHLGRTTSARDWSKRCFQQVRLCGLDFTPVQRRPGCGRGISTHVALFGLFFSS